MSDVALEFLFVFLCAVVGLALSDHIFKGDNDDE